MKRLIVGTLAALSIASSWSVQAVASVPLVPVVQSIGPDHKIWVRSNNPQSVETVQEGSGDAIQPSVDRRVVQVETGMHYWDGTQWTPSDATFDLTDDSFVANRLQYKVQLSAELNMQGAVNVTTRDNVLLKSTPVAIGLYDAQSGKSTIISAITNAGGVLVRTNVVLYTNAFTGVAADVVYTINKGSFEQDVVITGNLNPEDYGFPKATTRVQIYTEFYGAPLPDRIRRPLRVEQDENVRNVMVTPDLVDDVLGFGEFSMATGRAEICGSATSSSAPAAPVVKQFVTSGDRTLLIESVEYNSLYPPKSSASLKRKGKLKKPTAVAKITIPKPNQRVVAEFAKPQKKLLAQVPRNKGDVIVDYVGTIGPGFSTPTVFQGDTTYLVTGTVTCSSATTMEAGAVFKYKYISGTSTAYIQLNSTLTTTSTSHRPIIFTAVDDDSVGETMNGVSSSGYTGTINTNGYANPALIFNATAQTITDVRFRYCQEGMRVVSCFGTTVSHVQLVNCIKGVVITGCGSGCGTAITVNNGLISNVSYPLTFSWSPGASFVNCTIDNTPRLVTDTVSGSASFVNCVLANVTSLYSGTPTLSGNNNGFYSSPSFGTSTTTASATPFEPVKAGSYYMASSCLFRNFGTTSIDSTLASDLKKRTVFPPVVLTGTISGTYSPVAARDTDLPDLGYHYDPVDYIAREIAVTGDGNPLVLTNGVVMAFYGNYGIQVPEGGSIVSQGNPVQMNRFVWYPAVQEQPILLDTISTRSSALFDVSGATNSSATKPILKFRFTDFPMQGLAQDFFKGGAHPLNLNTLLFQDAWLRGVNLVVSSITNSFGANSVGSISIVNNLFERGTASIFNGYVTSGTTCQNPIAVSAYNNLFYQSTVSLSYYDSSATSHPSWTWRDNVFDHGTVSLAGDGSYSSFVTRSYDGFFSTTGASQLSGTGDVTLTALTYGTPNALGWRWYQNTRTPTLHDVDTGRTGADGGLYHYTTKASEGKETTSAMDIGFHYVVLNGSNLPVDTDGDGIPDYLEDTNGDGDGTNDATNWNSYNSPNGLTGTTGLQTFTPLR